MSRYTAHNTNASEPITYGFDDCGMPGWFLDTEDANHDTRAFMCEDEGDHLTKGGMVEKLKELQSKGYQIPERHIEGIALDLPI